MWFKIWSFASGKKVIDADEDDDNLPWNKKETEDKNNGDVTIKASSVLLLISFFLAIWRLKKNISDKWIMFKYHNAGNYPWWCMKLVLELLII